MTQIKDVQDMAIRVRSFFATRYDKVPLNILFAALLTVAAEIAHSQGMSNVEFRRVCRDVYRAQEEDFQNANSIP